LHESRRQIRSEQLLAIGLISLPGCPTAQANPPRLRSGLRLTRVDPSASLGMTKKAASVTNHTFMPEAGACVTAILRANGAKDTSPAQRPGFLAGSLMVITRRPVRLFASRNNGPSACGTFNIVLTGASLDNAIRQLNSRPFRSTFFRAFPLRYASDPLGRGRPIRAQRFNQAGGARCSTSRRIK